jgi:hypothetical protein
MAWTDFLGPFPGMFGGRNSGGGQGMGGMQNLNSMSGMQNMSPALNGLSAGGGRQQQGGQPQSGGGGWLQGLKKFGLGTPGSIESIPQFDEGQLQFLQFLLSGGMQQLQNPYEGFEPLAQEAMSDFEQRGLPALAEQFTSLGSNKITSPAFASQAGQARAGLSERLAAMKSMYGMQNRQQGLQQGALGLTQKNQNFSIPGQQGALGPILNAAAKIGTTYATGGMF